MASDPLSSIPRWTGWCTDPCLASSCLWQPLVLCPSDIPTNTEGCGTGWPEQPCCVRSRRSSCCPSAGHQHPKLPLFLTPAGLGRSV